MKLPELPPFDHEPKKYDGPSGEDRGRTRATDALHDKWRLSDFERVIRTGANIPVG